MTSSEGERFDAVVAGAGGAGLAASLAAAERGLSVLLVEARETFREDSNTAMSTSMVPAAGTRFQRAAGIGDDSVELFYEDIRRKSKGAADPVVAGTLARAAPELVEWLAGPLAVPFELVTDFNYPGHSRHRCHTVPDRSGSTLLRHLLGVASRQEEITMVVPMRLADVSLDGEGAISAVTLEGSAGTERVETRAVVLATNGFGASPELVSRYLPEIAGSLYFGGEGSTGDALRIGQRLGVDTAFLDAYQGHGSVATPHGTLLPWATVMHGGILVNANGGRFGDETVGYSEYGRIVLDQPGQTAWMIYDERIDAFVRSFTDYVRCLEAGAVKTAGDREELARLVGASAESLSETLDSVEAMARRGAADSFGRTDWAAPLEAPYRAVKVTGALFHTQGGLRTNGEAAVLCRGVPVPGLFAAGGAAAGISGHGADGYLAGNGLLSALGLGFLAGRAALR